MVAAMKVIAVLAMLGMCTAAATEKDRTITHVVKLLQGMLDKSVTEGDEERKIYAKFKCYCDSSEAEKRASIKDASDQIALLESEIEETQGDTGELSSECAELKTNMADNKKARDEADTLRGKENKAFVAEEKDLIAAIKQMKGAIETLAAVGADQTKSTGADNKQFMAGHKASLVSLQHTVDSALRAATALMSHEQRSSVQAFLQAPFTGTYTSQSAQVIGIVKSMRDTFKTNLGDARKTEKNAKETYDDFITLKKALYKEMSGSYLEKQKALGGNDKELSTKKKKLASAENQKASDEEFLDKLLPMCEDKAKGFANRKELRANEEAAIAEAISILNSDDAFASFGETDATKSGATQAGGGKFIQLRSVHRHMAGGNVRSLAQNVLKKAAADAKSTRLSKVIASLQANPFTEVLDEIDNMLEVIKEEGKADKKKHDWCKKERKENNDSLKQRRKEILALDRSIDQLGKDINHPKTGLIAMIAATEQSLVENRESQATETTDRTDENLAYQKDIKNLVAAESILTKGLKVLEAYYDDLAKKLADGEALVQEDPKAPEAWKGDGDFKGQSSKGNDVIGMLEFILKQTKAEENAAHADEEKAQADFEDSMTQLKKDEAKSEKNLAGYQEKLAEKQQDLLDAEEDLAKTTKDKEAIKELLLRIKPGCDFISKNIGQRNSNRKTESSALRNAIRLIKATPAYKTAVNEATEESYGDCKEPCVKNSAHVKCKACRSDVTVPAYCAGHKGTKGC